MTGSISPALALAQQLSARFSAFAQVVAVALGGSQAGGRPDPTSDIDLYVFTTEILPLAERQKITADFNVQRADLNLTFWDLGDEWFDGESGIEVDVIYWDPAWIEGQLARVVDQCQPSMGYSTCFWHTLRSARPLYDRAGWFSALQHKAAQPYPEALRLAIIRQNHAVLRRVIPSYTHQIEKAARRGDLVSVNHRVAALLASYFDVIFALNRVLHPGEKRLVQLVEERCPLRPAGMADQVRAVLAASAGGGDELIMRVNELVDGLDRLLLVEGFDPATSEPMK